MRIFATLAVLAALLGGAAALSRADATVCETHCDGSGSNCVTRCHH